MFNYRERPRCVLAVTMRVRRRRLVHRMLLRTLNDRLLLQVRRVVRDAAPVDDSDSGVTDFLDDVTTALDFNVRSNSCSGQLQLSFGELPSFPSLLIEAEDGSFSAWDVHNEHPEVSWSALWNQVWYEGYSEPEFIWQSSAATNEFEPKYSLVPLSFGTLKAAFYAMLLNPIA